LLFVHIPQALASSARFIIFLNMLEFLKKQFLKIFLVKENEAYLWNFWEYYTCQN
jgi:phage pi2 protein 07